MAVSAADSPSGNPEIDATEKVDYDVHNHLENMPVAMESTEDGQITLQSILAFLALASQINAYIMSLLIPSTVLTYINAELGPDPNYTWITVAWTLGSATVVSVGGRLSDIFGRRNFMMAGAIISILGTIVGATGRSIPQMIASGVLFGIGSGFQELCYACVQEIVPNRYRIMAVGGLDVSLAFAFSSPVISYAFIAYQPIGWRGAYWYMFAYHCFAFVLLFLFYKPPNFATKHREDGKTRLQLLAQLDYVGLLLFVSGSVLFLLGINFGGRTYPWSSAGTIAPIVIGFCCYVAVGCWCTLNTSLEYPLFPPRLFRKFREFDSVIIVCFVGGMLYYSMNVLWPRQSQLFFVGPNEIIMRGVYSIIFSCGTWIAGLITVFICSRLHHEKWQLIGFTVVQTALIGSMASVDANDKTQAIATVVIAAITITPPQLLSFTMLGFGLDNHNDLGVAVGLGSTFRLLGGSIATTIYTAIYTSRFAQVLPGELTAAIQASGVPYSDKLLSGLVAAANVNTAAAFNAVSGVTPALASMAADATKAAYVQGFSLVYLIAIAFGAAAIAAALCTVSTDRSKKNNARPVVMMNETKRQVNKSVEV